MTLPRRFEPLTSRADEIIGYFAREAEPILREDDAWPLVENMLTGRAELLDQVAPDARAQHTALAMCQAVDMLWRRSRVVYPVHADMLSELSDSTSKTLSGRALRRIPHTNPLLLFDQPICTVLPGGERGTVVGAYVFGTEGQAGYRHRRFCPTTDEQMNHLGLMTMTSLHDATGRHTHWDMARIAIVLPEKLNVAEAIELAIGNYVQHPTQHGRAPNAEVQRWWAGLLPTLLNIVLYTCTPDADMQPVPQPRAQRTKSKAGKQKQRPPKPIQLIKVGWRLGPALKEARAAAQRYRATGTGQGQPPHQRRGHFRTTKCGPGRQDEQLDYILPYMVRKDLLGELTNRLVPIERTRR